MAVPAIWVCGCDRGLCRWLPSFRADVAAGLSGRRLGRRLCLLWCDAGALGSAADGDAAPRAPPRSANTGARQPGTLCHSCSKARCRRRMRAAAAAAAAGGPVAAVRAERVSRGPGASAAPARGTDSLLQRRPLSQIRGTGRRQTPVRRIRLSTTHRCRPTSQRAMVGGGRSRSLIVTGFSPPPPPPSVFSGWWRPLVCYCPSSVAQPT